MALRSLEGGKAPLQIHADEPPRRFNPVPGRFELRIPAHYFSLPSEGAHCNQSTVFTAQNALGKLGRLLKRQGAGWPLAEQGRPNSAPIVSASRQVKADADRLLPAQDATCRLWIGPFRAVLPL
jgi:hypothetical protein